MTLRNKSIGSITEFKENEFGVEGKTAEHSFRITAYTDQIVRIQLSKSEVFDTNPFSVILNPESSDLAIEQHEHEIVLSTSSLRAIVSKNPLRLRFENKEGELLNADDPNFGTSWLGEEVTCYKQIHPSEIFLGMGEKTGGLNRRGSSFTNWNTDAFGYNNDSDPLYVSTPFFIGIVEGRPYGIFLDNTHKTHMNFGASNNDRFSYFSAEMGDMDYYFIQGDTVSDIIKAYSRLTGTIQMPPLWSLGFQQCRYSYYPDFEVKTLAKTFRDKKIPADVIYLDIHYMKDYKAFTFDGERFPDPKSLIEELEAQGFKVVVILDPGIKTEEGYGTYDRGKEADVFVKYPDGSRFEASVWPGNSHFTDFTSEAGRKWWADELKFYSDLGLEGFWNDMNEPACWGQDMPDMIEFDYEGEQVTHKKARNVYGYQMVRATYEGARQQIGNKRPFTLTRAGFSGVQRYSAVWTGDNVAGDDYMMLGQRLVNSLGLAGVPFAGYDVGGFVEESDFKLFARWLAVASFAPFFRVHSMVNTRDSEPWAYGEEVEEIARNYINLRYELLPYFYALFYEAHRTGMPVNRSLAIEYHQDQNIYGGNAATAFTLGESLLVCPTISTQDFAKIYIPEGNWYNFFTDEKVKGGQHYVVETAMEDLPVYAKEGAIIPMQSVIQHVKEATDGILRLHIYNGQVQTSLTYYEDDGETFDFEKGAYYERLIQFDGEGSELNIGAVQGNYSSKYSTLRLYLHGFDNKDFKVNGAAASVKKEDLTLLQPITEFDPLPQRDKKHLKIEALGSIDFAFTNDEINISW